MNTALGRPDIPVGENRTRPNAPCYLAHRRETEKRLYHRAIAERFPPGKTEDAVELYLRLLDQAEDSSVTICSIGLMTVLAEVMRRPDGMELIRRKVLRMISMADGFPVEGGSGFNWNMDPDATETVINDWPVELLISPVGTDVLTGLTLETLAADNPLRCAYEIWSGERGFRRPSWDQLAVLAASGIAFREGFLETTRRGKIVYNAAKGQHCWTLDDHGLHTCLGLCHNAEATAEWVEPFMREPWMTERKN